MTPPGKNRIMIFGPKDDGTYVVEFRTAEGEALAISIPRSPGPPPPLRRPGFFTGPALATGTVVWASPARCPR